MTEPVTPPTTDNEPADLIRSELERFVAIIEGRGEARLVTPHGMTSNGPKRALAALAAERASGGLGWEALRDIVMGEPAWPRSGAVRRRSIMAKIEAALATPQPGEDR